MRRILAGAAALALSGCGAQSTPAQNVAADSVLDNIVTAGLDLPWTMVDPDHRFDPHGPARSLAMPAALRGAKLGYFDEPQMLAQFSARQLADMHADKAGFTARFDLDHDGTPETYRTGFWQRGADSGTFVAVFAGGRLQDVRPTGNNDWFFSWHGGPLVVSGCNCSHQGEIAFVRDRLKITWSD